MALLPLAHTSRSGLPGAAGLSSRQGQWCLLTSLTSSPWSKACECSRSTCCILLRKPTLTYQLVFLTAATSSLPSSPLPCTSGLWAGQTRPRGHSFLRKADFSSRGDLPAGGCHARQIADALPLWPSESEMLACQSALW